MVDEEVMEISYLIHGGFAFITLESQPLISDSNMNTGKK